MKLLVAAGAFGLVVIALLMLAAMEGAEGSDSTPTAEVVLAPLFRSLHLRGELDAGRATTVVSTIGGDRATLISIIDAGTSVEAGDLLATIDPAPFHARLRELEDVLQQRAADERARAHAIAFEIQQAAQSAENARLELELAELELTLLLQGTGPEEIARLERELAVARQRAARFEAFMEEMVDLIERSALSEPEVRRTRAEAEQARWEAHAAERALEQYRAMVLPALERKAQVRVSRARSVLAETTRMAAGAQQRAEDEDAVARVARQRAERDVAQAREDVDRTRILAPGSGIVVHALEFRGGTRRAPRVGDRVFQGQPLVHLPDLSTMKVRTLVREGDLHKVNIGDAARVRVDAFPDVVMPGRVAAIGVLASKTDEGLASVGPTFPVELIIDVPDDRLRPGMTARVELVATTYQPLPLVPRQAVFGDDAETYCYVRVHENAFERRRVRVSAFGDLHAAIASGLSKGEHVALALPRPQEIKE